MKRCIATLLCATLELITEIRQIIRRGGQKVDEKGRTLGSVAYIEEGLSSSGLIQADDDLTRCKNIK